MACRSMCVSTQRARAVPGIRVIATNAMSFLSLPAAGMTANWWFMPSKRVISTRHCKIEENDDRRIANGAVKAGEGEAAALAVHAKHGDVVTSLIAAIEELAGRVEVEAARIVPARPFFPDICQGAGGSHGENPNAVVQPIAGIDKPAIA